MQQYADTPPAGRPEVKPPRRNVCLEGEPGHRHAGNDDSRGVAPNGIELHPLLSFKATSRCRGR
jgi:hypothetical protein